MYEKTLFRKPLPSELEETEIGIKEEKQPRTVLYDARYSEAEMRRIERDWSNPNAVIKYNAEFGLPVVLPVKEDV